MDSSLPAATETQVRFAWLPRPGTLGFHLMLAAVALLILGPLGGVAAAYMNFTLGIFVPGQILAGILGSVVTYPYGAEGRHGANYMQTMAASVASLGAMAVLIQAAVWLGMEMPPVWQLMLFISCVGMFGVGLGMLYTPILVDRMQLDYPSGYAVANIIRALTDKTLLKRSLRSLATGAGLGRARRLAHRPRGVDRRERPVDVQRRARASSSARASPFRPPSSASSAGCSPRGSGATGGSAGTSRSDDSGSCRASRRSWAPRWSTSRSSAARRSPGHAPRGPGRQAGAASGPRRTSRPGCSSPGCSSGAGAVVLVATLLMHQPARYVLFGLGLSILFVFVNGISTGVSDQNPISSAFVVSVLLMSAMGLRRSAGGDHRGHSAAHLQLGGRRHAAGPLDRLAPRHRPPGPVLLPGARHRHGRGSLRGAGPRLHAAPTRCWRSTASTTPRRRSGSGSPP